MKTARKNARRASALVAKAAGLAWGVRAGVGAGDLAGWRTALSLATIMLAARTGLAGPEGAQVVRGDVSISRSGNETLIRAGRNSIINYRSFDIAGHESVRFIQPDANSRVLNRIGGASPTRIDGALTANGRVYIVNPAGVVFGGGARVNVAGIFAAAGQMSDADFVRGKDRFSLTGSVVNEGSITGSFVGLLGKHTANMGTIMAPDGAVVMAAGADVYVGQRDGTTYVKVEGAASAPAGRAGAENAGTIDAGRGRAVIAAGDMYSLAVRSTGSVRARSVSVQGQGAGTVEVLGRIDATPGQTAPRAGHDAQRGGSIEVTGQRVALRGASLDASGQSGGGTIHVGGDFQGKGSRRSAERTYVDADTTLRADATGRGQGGTVVVWSDQATNFEGLASARGGMLGGDGGMVEVSGKELLRFRGFADVSAPRGKAGRVLLDPRDITIVNGGADDVGMNDEFLENSSTDVSFDADLLTAILDTGAALTLQANRDLTVNESIIVNNAGGDGGALTMQAGRNIAINADITTDNGALTLIANDANALLTDRDVGNGGIAIGGGLTIDVGTASFTLTVSPQTAGFDRGDVSIGASTAITAGSMSVTGADTFTTGIGTITLSSNTFTTSGLGSIALDATISTPGAILLQADGAITIGDDLTGASITVHAGRAGGGTLSFSAAGVTLGGDTIVLRAGNGPGGGAGASVDLITNVPSFTATASGATSPMAFFVRQDALIADADIADASQFGGGLAGMSYTLRSEEATVTLSTASKVAGAGLVLVGGSGVAIDTDISVGSLNVAGDATLSGNVNAGAGFVIFNNALDLGAADRTITGGAMLFSGDVASTGGGLSIVNSGLFTLAGEVQLGGGGAFSQSGGGSVVLNNNVRTSGGSISFADAITLGAGAPSGLVRLDSTLSGGTPTGGLISLGAAVDAASAGDQGLIIDAGTGGNVLASAPIGASTRLSEFTITNASNVATLSVRADAITLDNVVGTAEFNGILDATNTIDLAGNVIEVNLGATSGGIFTINNSGLATLQGGAITTPAGFNQSGAGAVRLGSNITTDANTIAFTGPVTLISSVTLDSTNAGASAAGAGISFADTLRADASGNARALTIDAGTAGSVLFAGNLGGAGNDLASVDVTAFATSLRGVRTLGAQNYFGGVTINGDLRSLSSGAITLNGPVTVAGDSRIETAGLSGSHDIVLNSTVDALAMAPSSNLELVSGVGDVLIAGAVGSTRALTAFTASGASIDVPSVVTSGAQTFSGPTILRGNATGTAITFGGSLELRANSTINGTTSTSFNGVVNSQSGMGFALTVLSPTTTFFSDIGTAGGGELGSLDTDAGSLTLGGGVIRAINDIIFGDAVTLGANVLIASTSGGVQFLGAVNSDSTLRALQIETGGGSDTIFGSSVGATNALRSLVTNADGRTFLGGDVVTFDHQFYRDAVVLNSNAVLTGNSISFFSTINSDGTTGGRALSVNGGSGGITVSGAVGGQNPLTSLVMTGSHITLASATTKSFQTYNGLTSIFGDLRAVGSGAITINGDFRPRGMGVTVRTLGQSADDDIIITGSINTRLGNHGVTLAAGLGDVSLSGDVGFQDRPLDFIPSTLTISGGTVTLRGVRTLGSQLYSGSTTLRGDLTTLGSGSIAMAGTTRLGASIAITTNAGPIVFGGALDSDATARSLVLLTGGGNLTRFVGAVGATSPLLSLFTNSDGSTRIEGGSIRTTGDLQFDNRVTLASATILTANDIVFSSTINSDGIGTPRALTLNSTTDGSDIGETTFAGAVGGIVPLRSISTNVDGTTRIGANLTTTEGMTFADTVHIVSDVTLHGGNGTLFFRSTVDTDPSATDRSLTLLSNAPSTADSAPFKFGASVGNIRRLGTLTLGADRPDPQWAATAIFTDAFNASGQIARSGVANSDLFIINTGSGGFTMGRNQKLTAFGTVRITSDGTVRLGDITALTNIEVTAPSIVVRRRVAGELQDNIFQTPDQRVSDVGIDFVASGVINFSRTPTLEGSGLPRPTFATNTGNPDPELSAFAFRLYPEGVRTDRFADTRTGNNGLLLGLDLRSEGPTIANTATSMAGALPSAATGVVTEPVLASNALLDALAQVGLPTRDLPFAQIVESLAGRVMYGDLPARGRPSAEAGDYRVSRPRLSTDAVLDVIDAHRALAFVPTLDDQGRPVLGDDGRPLGTDRTPFIKQVLTGAWTRYAAQATEPTGAGLRAHLERLGASATPEDAQALDFLNKAREVFDRLDTLGLSPFEASIPKSRLINDIKPAAMTAGEFRAAVYGGVPAGLALGR